MLLGLQSLAWRMNLQAPAICLDCQSQCDLPLYLSRSRFLAIWSRLTNSCQPADPGSLMAELILNLYEAKTALSRLVERAASGEEIIIAKNGRPQSRNAWHHNLETPGTAAMHQQSGTSNLLSRNAWHPSRTANSKRLAPTRNAWHQLETPGTNSKRLAPAICQHQQSAPAICTSNLELS